MSKGKDRKTFKGFSYKKGSHIAFEKNTNTKFSNPEMYIRILKEKGIKTIRTKKGKFLSVERFFELKALARV